MESEKGTCSTCGSSEISIENYEYVCCNCGSIIGPSETGLNDLPDSEAYVDKFRNKDYEASSRLNNCIRNETNSSARDKQIYRRKILEDARKTVTSIVKDGVSLEEIMTMLAKALDNSKRTSGARKSALVGACIYTISKKNNLGFTISDICKNLCIKLKLFNESMRLLHETDPQSVDLKCNIYEACIKSIMRNSAIDLMDAHDKHMMERKIKLILIISDRMNKHSQRSPQVIVRAAAYLAWKSINTISKIVKKQTDLSFTKFCDLLDVNRTNRMSSTVTDLTKLIVKLASPICDIEKEKKRDLDYLLHCIIENSPTLLEEYLSVQSDLDMKSKKSCIVADNGDALDTDKSLVSS